MPLLEVTKLDVTMGQRQVLFDVNLSLERGDRLAIIGESGAGKSTLMRAIARLLPAAARTTGTISFDGTALPGGLGRDKRIGILLQDDRDRLDPLRSGMEQLSDAVEAPDEAERRRSVLAWLGRVGLDPVRAQLFPEQLGVRERQALAVALTLAREPELLLADDPTAGLDGIGQRRVLDLLESICRERRMTLLLVSPDLKAVAMLAETVAVLHAGRIVEAGRKTDVLGHPRHDYTRSVLSAGRLRQRTLMRTPIGDTLIDVRAIGRRAHRRLLPARADAAFSLEGISFEMRAGDSLALFGSDGAGKSMVARIVAGLERATTGEVLFGVHRYHGADLPVDCRADIAFVFPDARSAFDPRLPLGTSIAEPLRLEIDLAVEDAADRIAEVTEAVGLSLGLLAELPGALNLAQLQRFAIARALITRPKLVVLDEPALALGIGERNEILILLDRLRADYGLSYLVATRDFDTARLLADRVLVMDRGHVVEAGSPAQLAERPQHAVTQRLMAATLPETGIVPVF